MMTYCGDYVFLGVPFVAIWVGEAYEPPVLGDILMVAGMLRRPL